MLGIKEKMTQVIHEQPDDSSYDEIMRELAFGRMIERGLKGVKEGKVITNDAMKKQVKLWHK